MSARRGSDLRILIVVLAFLTLTAGCSTRSGVAEFITYKSVFDDSAAVSTSIIDQLAASERAIGRYARLGGNTSAGKRFVVADAAYFSEQADPPLAAHYRKALDVISRYNTIMLGYATGQGFDQLDAEIQALATESAKTADLVTGTTKIAGQFTPYLGLLHEFAKLGLSARSRAVFRDKALLYHDDIVSLIETMRDGAPEVFDILADPIERDILNATISNAGTRELQAKHYKMRILISDWVVLMNRNIEALNAVTYAIENPSLGPNLSGTTASLLELQTTVSAVRKRLAEINGG